MASIYKKKENNKTKQNYLTDNVNLIYVTDNGQCTENPEKCEWTDNKNESLTDCCLTSSRQYFSYIGV